ncbi:MAG: hypothetical protein GXY61_06560 [Lentisphaerae bacterium]|jgi:hypothetical protein|nr:hypothetical protein [Lentisphaerota bacterium]
MSSTIPQEHYDAITRRMKDVFDLYNGKDREGRTPSQLILHYMKRLGTGRDPYVELSEKLFYRIGSEYVYDTILKPNYSKEEITHILLVGLHTILSESLAREQKFAEKVKFWCKPIGYGSFLVGLFLDIMLKAIHTPILSILLPAIVLSYYIYIDNKENQRNKDIEDIDQLNYVWEKVASLKDENKELRKRCEELKSSHS